MTLREALEALQIADHEPVFAGSWDRIQAARPEPVPFLEPAFVRWACEFAGLNAEITSQALATATRVRDDEALRAMAWWRHSRFFGPADQRPRDRGFPTLNAALGNEAGMFNVLVLLSGTPYMQAVHRARGVPESVTREQVVDLDINLHTEDYLCETGTWGIGNGILGWLLLTWWGDLYRLGRLQFIPSNLRSPFHAYRHRATGAVVALSDGGLPYRADGQREGSAGIYDAEGRFTSVFEVGDDVITGNPVSPEGYVLREPITLARREWTPAMGPNSPCLDIHIPAGAPMDFGECGESMRRALEFFPRHFPERPFVGFACHSWILDNLFPDLLPATSNLVRFQREVYLFPIPRGGGVIRRVFGYGFEETDGAVSGEDRARLPRDTGMQRAFAAHLDTGGRFRGGGCFLLKEDLDWGREVYRSNWPLWQPPRSSNSGVGV